MNWKWQILIFAHADLNKYNQVPNHLANQANHL